MSQWSNRIAEPLSREAIEKALRHLLNACDRCGTQMVNHHCKLQCPRCGYTRDCSDP